MKNALAIVSLLHAITVSAITVLLQIQIVNVNVLLHAITGIVVSTRRRGQTRVGGRLWPQEVISVTVGIEP
jgi:hypothetical protein